MIEIGCFGAEIGSGQSNFMPFCCKKLSKVAKPDDLIRVVADRNIPLHILLQKQWWLQHESVLLQ